jgi:hypothetical protein
MGKWDVVKKDKALTRANMNLAMPSVDSLASGPIDSSKDNPTLNDLASDPLTTILRAGNKYIANPVQNAADSTLQALKNIPENIRSMGDDQGSVHENLIHGTSKTGELAKNAMGVLAAPFTTATAPAAKLIDKASGVVSTPLKSALADTTSFLTNKDNPLQVEPDEGNESTLGYLGKMLTSPEKVSSGTSFGDEMAALAPMLIMPEVKGETPLVKRPLDTLVGASPLAHAIAQNHAESGGSTFSLHDGNLVGKNRYAVSLFPERSEQVQGQLTPEYVQNFIENNRDLLKHPKTAVGTWAAPDGNHYLDVSVATPSKADAIGLGQKYNQRSIFDLNRMNEVPTGGTGESVEGLPSEADRLNDVPDTPTPEQFSGVHYSKQAVKNSVLSGDMRGSSGVGAEKSRLNLGNGAAPGVYFYREGSRPEAMIGPRENMSRVNGRYALAELESTPEWADKITEQTQAYKEKGFNDTQAHLMAINDAEHHLRDIGYDGYYSGYHPNSVFLFGDHKVSEGVSSFNHQSMLDNTAKPSDWEAVDHQPLAMAAAAGADGTDSRTSSFSPQDETTNDNDNSSNTDNTNDSLYHVTHTKSIKNIQKKGLLPIQTSNWTEAKGQRLGGGEVHTFTHFEDAVRWANKMDWAFNTELGSGKISIIKLKNSPGWEVDLNDPISQASNKGQWLKRPSAVPPTDIQRVIPFTNDLIRASEEPPYAPSDLIEQRVNAILAAKPKKKKI